MGTEKKWIVHKKHGAVIQKPSFVVVVVSCVELTLVDQVLVSVRSLCWGFLLVLRKKQKKTLKGV